MFVENVQKNVPVEKDVPFILTDMDYDVFLIMIEFIYTNSISVLSKIVRFFSPMYIFLHLLIFVHM